MPKPKIADGIQSTVMAIRENIMEYYKGTCIERLTSSNISRREVSHNYNYHYERDNYHLMDEQQLMIGSIPILNLKKHPEITILYGETLGRSKSFRAVNEGIEYFFAKHLDYVELVHSPEGSRSGWQGDKQLILQNAQPSTHEDVMLQEDSTCIALNGHPNYNNAPGGDTFDNGNRRYVRRNSRWWHISQS